MITDSDRSGTSTFDHLDSEAPNGLPGSSIPWQQKWANRWPCRRSSTEVGVALCPIRAVPEDWLSAFHTSLPMPVPWAHLAVKRAGSKAYGTFASWASRIRWARREMGYMRGCIGWKISGRAHVWCDWAYRVKGRKQKTKAMHHQIRDCSGSFNWWSLWVTGWPTRPYKLSGTEPRVTVVLRSIPARPCLGAPALAWF